MVHGQQTAVEVFDVFANVVGGVGCGVVGAVSHVGCTVGGGGVRVRCIGVRFIRDNRIIVGFFCCVGGRIRGG